MKVEGERGATVPPVAAWLRELEVARRLRRYYPSGHPALQPARQRLLDATVRLGAAVQVVGVRPSGFFLGNERLAGTTRHADRLADQLFHLGVIALRLAPPVPASSAEHLADLLAGLTDRPSEDDRERILATANELPGVELVPIDVGRVVFSSDLSALAGSGATLWRLLVERVSGGALTAGEEGGVSPREMASLADAAGDPLGFMQLLVDHILELLGESETDGAVLDGLAFMAAIDDMLRALAPDQRQLVARLLVERATPEGSLRARLPELLPAELVLDAVDALVGLGIAVPETVQELVYQLAAPLESARDPWRRRGLQVSPDVVDRARTILQRLPGARGGHAEPATPIRRLVELPALRRFLDQQQMAEELELELVPDATRRHLEAALQDVQQLWPGSEGSEVLASWLRTLYFEHLELGEFESATELAAIIIRGVAPEGRLAIASPAGLDALLEALAEWGKSRRTGVMQIVTLLGLAVVPSLLDRLEVEESLSVRRRLLEMVVAVGEPAIPHLRALLDSREWFVVRNALLLLGRLQDPSLPELAARHLKDADPRVVAEAATALAAVRDERWVDGVVRLLELGGPLAVREAVGLSGHFHHPRVARMLLAELKERSGARLRDPEVPALIEAVGATPTPEGVAELERLAHLHQWRYSFRLTAVREAVARACARVPPGQGRPILEHLARLRDSASEVARRLLEEEAGEDGS